jgi:hypothetical protein
MSNRKTCVIGVVYANWCPHCKTLVGDDTDPSSYKKSDWFRIQTILENVSKGIKYIVDRTESEDTTNMNRLKTHHIVANGFPTIYKYYLDVPKEQAKGLEKSSGLEYFSNGPRDINSILKWARNHAKGSGFKFSGGRLKSKRRLRRVNKTRRMTRGRGRMTRRL